MATKCTWPGSSLIREESGPVTGASIARAWSGRNADQRPAEWTQSHVGQDKDGSGLARAAYIARRGRNAA